MGKEKKPIHNYISYNKWGTHAHVQGIFTGF